MSGITGVSNTIAPGSLNAAAGSHTGSRDAASFSSLLRAARLDHPLPLEGEAEMTFQLNRIPNPVMLERHSGRPLEFDRGNAAPISLSARAPVDENELRESARKLVASALLMPVLEQMENSPFRPKEGPFSQNVVERRFGPLMHQQMADRMMEGRSFGLVDAVLARIAGTASGGGAGTLEIRA
jgi:hypothetical protein